MLDAFIIEELRRREEDRSHAEQPRMEMPMEEHRERPPVARDEETPNGKSDRGVIIIDF